MKGLIISNFTTGTGILLETGDGNTIVGNWIGNVDNELGTASNSYGIQIIDGSGSNIIGGTTLTDRNVISGNTVHGISIDTAGLTTDVRILGNYIGTNWEGTAGIGNLQGVSVSGSNSGIVIGGTAAGARNIISGNAWGVIIELSGGYSIQGNYIGLNAAGTAAIPNSTGVQLESGNGVVGGTTPEARNIISGNEFGVGVLYGGTLGLIKGNYIGTNPSWYVRLGQRHRHHCRRRSRRR